MNSGGEIDEKIIVRCPFDKMEITRIDIDDAKAVDKKLQTAYTLANDRNKWLPVHKRIAILEKTAALMQRQVDFLNKLGTAEKINASAVMINDHTAFRVDWMPFGGRDTSGIGVGGIPYSMHEMTREKLIVIKR